MTDEYIGTLIWIIGEIIVIGLVIYDYCKYSDSRSKYDQDDCNAWYGLAVMAWPFGATVGIVVLLNLAFGWFCMKLLEAIKYCARRTQRT